MTPVLCGFTPENWHHTYSFAGQRLYHFFLFFTYFCFGVTSPYETDGRTNRHVDGRTDGRTKGREIRVTRPMGRSHKNWRTICSGARFPNQIWGWWVSTFLFTSMVVVLGFKHAGATSAISDVLWRRHTKEHRGGDWRERDKWGGTNHPSRTPYCDRGGVEKSCDEYSHVIDIGSNHTANDFELHRCADSQKVTVAVSPQFR